MAGSVYFRPPLTAPRVWPGQNNETAKMPAVGAGALLGGSGCCGRGDDDGREEGAAAPLEVLRALPPVTGDRVVSVL